MQTCQYNLHLGGTSSKSLCLPGVWCVPFSNLSEVLTPERGNQNFRTCRSGGPEPGGNVCRPCDSPQSEQQVIASAPMSTLSLGTCDEGFFQFGNSHRAIYLPFHEASFLSAWSVPKVSMLGSLLFRCFLQVSWCARLQEGPARIQMLQWKDVSDRSMNPRPQKALTLYQLEKKHPWGGNGSDWRKWSQRLHRLRANRCCILS